MKAKAKQNLRLPTIPELEPICTKLSADERYERFRSLVPLTAWCGLRFGDVSNYGAETSTEIAPPLLSVAA